MWWLLRAFRPGQGERTSVGPGGLQLVKSTAEVEDNSDTSLPPAHHDNGLLKNKVRCAFLQLYTSNSIVGHFS